MGYLKFFGKNRAIAIIQARMGSTRLPGKTMKEIDGVPLLQYMIDRVNCSELIDGFCVATTCYSKAIIDYCQEKFIPHYVGNMDENNVALRVINAAHMFGADVIVDLTSDCPLVDPNQIDYLLAGYRLNGKYDYASNIDPRSWPDGFDIQIYQTKLLEVVYKKLMEQREFNHLQHTGWNILNLGLVPEENRYRLKPPGKYRLPKMRVTVDYPEDFEVVKSLIAYINEWAEERQEIDKWLVKLDSKGRIKNKVCPANAIIDYLIENPKLLVNKNRE